MALTPTEQKARVRLGEDLGTWIERYRKDDRSWRWIAKQLATATAGEVDVTGEYLRQMFNRQKAA
ncbi:hypothetical protein [Amycolatopsis vancoresmycina]|uniref:hypothetical protein n=1 Tax=Amycolatopsis vancoresmycina TaxID=208444 RepID=UPI000527039F|nr:hypothetical protein [Amycolatopsis vancoresmycina]